RLSECCSCSRTPLCQGLSRTVETSPLPLTPLLFSLFVQQENPQTQRLWVNLLHDQLSASSASTIPARACLSPTCNDRSSRSVTVWSGRLSIASFLSRTSITSA